MAILKKLNFRCENCYTLWKGFCLDVDINTVLVPFLHPIGLAKIPSIQAHPKVFQPARTDRPQTNIPNVPRWGG